jgi:hypothetical protein
MENNYRVKVRYTFEGWYGIAAKDERQAREIAGRDCGLVIGGNIHTSNGMCVKEWEFGMHPEKRVVSSKRIEQPKQGRA